MLPLGLLHQVFMPRKIRNAGKRGKHTLVGMGAIGKKTIKKQACSRQLIKLRCYAFNTRKSPDIGPGKAFHHYKYNIFGWAWKTHLRCMSAQDWKSFRCQQFIIRGENRFSQHRKRLVPRHTGYPVFFGRAIRLSRCRFCKSIRSIERKVVGEQVLTVKSIPPP